MYQKEFAIEFFEVVLLSYEKFVSFIFGDDTLSCETIEEAIPPRSVCVLCSDEIFPENEFKTPCDHVFHNFCVKRIFEESKTVKCPICERPLTERDVAGLKSLCVRCQTAVTWFFHCDNCREKLNILYQQIKKHILYEESWKILEFSIQNTNPPFGYLDITKCVKIFKLSHHSPIRRF
ncbi:hypothetical protein AVEN_175953-1 [Araneus ventricosus]|uniref:RING-type domain-containing protein n=1 Tax=Araneus ventricosus TaxID=182803 RepID=A0A4Y2AUL8_ARAVE|nr:hypothetical protein AVEN_22316-1 [Araneus ventricosus]GBL83867.1 hypothetical protein AVEN_175953-1 [Araneus ventricosus]